MTNKRINIFVGHFGSGKTETALNYAKLISETGRKTVLVDLDIVNPFFRSSDVENELNNHNIKLIKPIFANSNIDIPALSGEINSVFEDKSYTVIFDVGGDDLGAKALSRYKDFIEGEDYEMYLVINTKRPYTKTKEQINTMLKELERSSRLKITLMVNNTNLLDFTKVNDILEGSNIIKEVARDNNIPLGFICASESIENELSKYTDEKIIALHRLIKLPWE
jgi:hypothetical protein